MRKVIEIGAWGYGVFENDDACDVKDRFNQYINSGMSVVKATEACAKWWPDCLKDINALLAIAALQMERKSLQPEIKKKCLQMIEVECEVRQWNNPEKHKRELEKLKNHLIHYKG